MAKQASKDSRQAHGAAGKTDLLLFDPEVLTVINDPKHALYDARVDEVLPESFILNLMAFGVLEPVLVRKDNESGETIVEAGRKRTLGLRIANKRLAAKGLKTWRIQAVPKRGTEADAVLRMMVENDQRFDDTPVNRARKASKALEMGKTEEEVACAMGVSVATVKNLLKLLDAPAAVRNAVDAGKITATDGYKLAKFSPEEAREKVAELIEKAPRTPGKKRATKAAAKKARDIVDGPKPAKDPTATGLAPSVFGHRSDNQIENVANEIATSPHFSKETSRVVKLFADWLLGEDAALDTLLKPPTASAAE